MFWGLRIKQNTLYSHVVKKTIHFSQATLDVKSVESDEYVQVFVKVDNENHLVCNLNLAIPQVSFDLGFSKDDGMIWFFSQGAGIIHLTGYTIEDENEDFVGELYDVALEEEAREKKDGEEDQPSTRTLEHDVVIEDLLLGNGTEAEEGKQLSVYYKGRLKSNNKEFDSAKVGDGFKFYLGRSQVIQGWEIGLAGMKVGGSRRITCPPNTAFGAEGMLPNIPPYSTLVYDIELREVN